MLAAFIKFRRRFTAFSPSLHASLPSPHSTGATLRPTEATTMTLQRLHKTWSLIAALCLLAGCGGGSEGPHSTPPSPSPPPPTQWDQGNWDQITWQ